jgi:hypothetical protein
LINDGRRRPRLDSLGWHISLNIGRVTNGFIFGGTSLYSLSFHGWLIYYFSGRPSAEIAQKEDVVDKRKTRDKSAEPLADING